MPKLNPRTPSVPAGGPLRARAAGGAQTLTAAQAATRSAERAQATPDTRTALGGSGYRRDERTELFTLATSNFVGEETFHEKAADRDERFARLVRESAVRDGVWFAGLLRWLRHEGNMRDAPIVAAAEAVRARLDAGDLDDGVTNSALVRSVLVRADEPGKLVSYWSARFGAENTGGGHPRRAKLPSAVKRGINDRLAELYTEFSAFKYDSAGAGVRFGDVIELTHPAADGDARDDLYRWLLDRRHNRADGEYPNLVMLRARAALNAGTTDADERRMFLRKVATGDEEASNAFARAGMTWETAASWLGGELDASFWESMIPRMGYMALLRNLANFDKVGISSEVAAKVAAKLADPAQVARSRQFPYRFLTAYLQGLSSRWTAALDEALTHATVNVPELGGRTLVLVDTSGSMGNPWTKKSQATCVQTAALFGVTLAQRANAVDLVGFATGSFVHPIKTRANTKVLPSVLAEINRFCGRIGEVGHGTQIADAMRRNFNDHDRVVIISDEQTYGGGSSWAHGDTNRAVPASVPVYAFNLGGYAAGSIAAGTPNRHQLGGITDATFSILRNIEMGKNGTWPWEKQADATV